MFVSTLSILLASDFPTYVDHDAVPLPPNGPTIVMGIISATALVGAMIGIIVLTIRHNREHKDKDGMNPPV